MNLNSKLVIIALIGGLLTITGCAIGTKQVDLSFLKDAEELSHSSGATIGATSTSYLPAPPAPIIIPEVSSTVATPTASSRGAVSTSTVKYITNKATTGPSYALSISEQYRQAVSQYKDRGYYFQFSNCQATPGSMSIKKDVRFMLDNRDAKSRKIGIGSKIYTLEPYGFIIATVNTVGLKYITCDGGGSAQINVSP